MSAAAAGTCANGGTVILGTCSNGQTTGINACSGGSPGGTGVPASGSVDSNTITFGAIMPAVTMVARAAEAAPFAVAETGILTGANALAAGAGTFAGAAGGAAGCGVFTNIPAGTAIVASTIGKFCGGLTNGQIQRATRGIASASVTGTGAAGCGV